MHEIIDKIKELSNAFTSCKSLARLHEENRFSKHISFLLGGWNDFLVFWERVEKETAECRDLSTRIISRNEEGDKEKITELDQKLRRRENDIMRCLNADTKALFIFSKIFLDNFIQLIAFVLGNPRDIATRSISEFTKSLEKKSQGQENSLVNDYAEEFLPDLRNICDHLVYYRNQYIEHDKMNQRTANWRIFGASFIFSRVCLGFPEEKKKQLNTLLGKLEPLSDLRDKENLKSIAKEVFKRLPTIPECQEKGELKNLLREIGISSLTPQELSSKIKGFFDDSCDFLTANIPELIKLDQARLNRPKLSHADSNFSR